MVEEEALESDEYEAVDATEEAMAFAGVERAGSGEVVVGREDERFEKSRTEIADRRRLRVLLAAHQANGLLLDLIVKRFLLLRFIFISLQRLLLLFLLLFLYPPRCACAER